MFESDAYKSNSLDNYILSRLFLTKFMEYSCAHCSADKNTLKYEKKLERSQSQSLASRNIFWEKELRAFFIPLRSCVVISPMRKVATCTTQTYIQELLKEI